jgi:hypothetical protein
MTTLESLGLAFEAGMDKNRSSSQRVLPEEEPWASESSFASGDTRVVEQADGARLDGPFFLVTRWHAGIRLLETVLTLRSQDVIAAEVLHNSVRTEYVLGSARGAE